VVVTIFPPFVGNLSDSYYLSLIGRNKQIDVKVIPSQMDKHFDKELNHWVLAEKSDNETINNILLVKGNSLPSEFAGSNELVIKAKFDKTQNAHIYYSTSYINPLMTLPYIPDLEERAKILNFHVPMSWISVLAYLISMIYAIMYLKNRNFENDIKASASAYLGTIFTILATVTGMLWAKFNWGTYWNWDPRETSIFILLLIYFAYFTLRASIDNRELKARLSSVYSIIAFITVPFLIFILPRIISGLHPGSADDNSLGPVLDAGSEAMNINKQITFSLALFAFTLVYFWMLNIFVRFKLLKERYDKLFN
jgi:heme exporter protein C